MLHGSQLGNEQRDLEENPSRTQTISGPSLGRELDSRQCLRNDEGEFAPKPVLGLVEP